jgi:chromosome partitioning protein
MHTIVMVSQKGGAGKSTLGVHLAVEGHRRGLRTLVIDLDPQATATTVLARRGDEPPDVKPEHAPRLEAALKEAEDEGYDLVVIDTAARADSGVLRAAKTAHLSLVPLRPSIVDLDAVEATTEILSLAKCPALYVLNAVAPQGSEADEAQALIEGRGGRVSSVRIGARKIFSQAFNSGQTAQEIEIRSAAATEIMALFEQLSIPMKTPQSHNHTRAVTEETQ